MAEEQESLWYSEFSLRSFVTFWFDSLRQGAATVLNKQQDIPQDQRVEFVPVEWRSSLKLDEGNTSMKGPHATPSSPQLNPWIERGHETCPYNPL